MGAVDSVNASAERALAAEVYEHAVILAVNIEDKAAFQRYNLSLRPYYTTYAYEALHIHLCIPIHA